MYATIVTRRGTEGSNDRDPAMRVAWIAARSDASATDLARAVDAAGDVGRLVDLLKGHRLLTRTAMRLAEDPSPTRSVAALRASAAEATRRRLPIVGEMLRIVGALRDAGIPHLVWKGAPLALRVGERFDARDFNDIDIVLRRRQYPAADRVVRDLGYDPLIPLSPEELVPYLHYEHDREYQQRDSGIHLELHWRFFDRYVAFGLEPEELLSLRMERVEIGGEELLRLPVEEELLLLALHGGKHGWSSMGWVVDVGELVRREPIDVERLERLMRRTGTARIVALALQLAAEIVAPLPERLERLAVDPEAARLARQVIEGPLSRPRLPSDQIEDYRFYLATRERLRDRLWFRIGWLLTPNVRDTGALTLPGGLWRVAPLVRLVRLVMRVGRR